MRSAWNYLQFHNCFGAEFRSHSENLYELVMTRDPTVVQFQPPFCLFPDPQEFPTRDIFSPHPMKPDLWAYEGKSDDLIVFLTGLKTNPLAFEHTVANHPEIRSVLMTGNKRLQPALIVEPVENSALSMIERAQLIERIWPLVQEANTGSPAHAKVLKTHIMIALPEKCLKRAGKGTVQRASTLEMYSEELDTLYTDADRLVTSPSRSQVRYLAEDDLTQCVLEEILKVTGWKGSFDRRQRLRTWDGLVAGFDTHKGTSPSLLCRRRSKHRLCELYCQASCSSFGKVDVRRAGHAGSSRNGV